MKTRNAKGNHNQSDDALGSQFILLYDLIKSTVSSQGEFQQGPFAPAATKGIHVVQNPLSVREPGTFAVLKLKDA